MKRYLVIYSGHARTIEATFANHYWMVLRHFQSPQIVLSLEDEPGVMEKLGPLLSRYPDAHINLCKQPDFAHWNDSTAHYHAPYAISVRPEAIMGQLWHLATAYEFANRVATEWDLCARIRTDLWFQCMSQFFDAETDCAKIPFWGRFGGMNDRFAVMGMDAADAYFNTYHDAEELLALGCPLHPESLLYAQMQSHRITLASSRYIFGTLREDGSFRHPEILPFETK